MSTTEGKFILVMHQAGEGCDYTIGCGVAWDELSSTTVEDAVVEARGILEDEGRGCLDADSDRCLKEAFIARVEASLPIAAWQAGLEAKKHAAAAEKATARERAEYERLQKKFGGGR